MAAEFRSWPPNAWRPSMAMAPRRCCLPATATGHLRTPLLNCKNLAVKCSLQPVAAAACIAEHTIVPSIAHGRPDKADFASLAKFASALANKIATLNNGQIPPLNVPGKRPYKEFKSNPLPQSVNDNCIQCGECARQCPTAAINMNDARIVAKENAFAVCAASMFALSTRAIPPRPLSAPLAKELARYARRQTERIFWRVRCRLYRRILPSRRGMRRLGLCKWRLLPKILQTYSRQISSLESNFRLSRLRPRRCHRASRLLRCPVAKPRAFPGTWSKAPASVRRP